MSIDADHQHGRLLVVDDEPNIADLLATALRFVGFEVDTAASGREAVSKAAANKPDLILLDVMLPDFDGFEVVRRLRLEAGHVPVIFLTARDSTADAVRGLTIGGDDYITKPFSLEEVIARVRAVMRRASTAQPAESNQLVFADLEMDEDLLRVRRGGVPVDLSPTEFKLLRYLLSNPKRVLSKSMILDHVWQYDFGGEGSVVETYISYLRKKLDPLGPPLIHTVRGFGYVLRQSDAPGD
ncbi:MAG: two component transcriptional regulator, winged helix family [Acidimicrobiia bacterium]|nr:two component transcriptional regulator, winged helix family [Acidimicrobiia bacterium]